jgi:predicted transcriptional regulator
MRDETIDWSSKIHKGASAIVAAYVTNNSVAQSELPALIALVADALTAAAASRLQSVSEKITKPTKGEIEKSIQRDRLISFIDGKPYKALRRHLRFKGQTPESYRALYGLPVDYPMVAPSYSERRTEISRQISAMRRR